MKTKLIKNIQQAIPKEGKPNDLHYLVIEGCADGGAESKSDYHIYIFFKSDKTVFHFWIGIIGKPKIDIQPLEVEPMDKDGAVAFAKNHFIEKIKQIL
jgi:hypothetical protein